MQNETSFFSLTLIVLLALAVPLLNSQLRRVRIPIVVGEIIAGIIIGKSGLHIVEEDSILALLSSMGFVFLMFLSGLEIDIDAVLGKGEYSNATNSTTRKRFSPGLIGILSFAITLVVAGGFAILLKTIGLIQDAPLMGLILATTSLGVVVPTLKERRELNTAYGQSLLTAALVADFITLLLISIYVIFHTSGPTLEVLAVLVLLGVFLVTYRVLGRLRANPPLEGFFDRLSEAAGQLETRGALAIAVVFIALSEWLGVEIILGAFLGGVLIAMLSKKEDTALREKLDAMGYGFFIPIFFIMVGVEFDLPALLSSPRTLALVPVLLIIAFAIKMAAGLAFRLNFSWRRTLGAGFLLSSRLTLIIAASAIGLELGAIDSAMNSAIILLAVVTCTVAPALFNQTVPAPSPQPKRQVLVVGDTEDAIATAQRFSQHADPVALIVPETLRSQVDSSLQLERVIFHNSLTGDTVSQLLKEAGAHHTETLIAMLHDDRLNLRVCQEARVSYAIPHIIALVNDPANEEAFTAAGVATVNIGQAELTMIENLARTPTVFTMLSTPLPDHQIVELTVRNIALDNTPLYALNLPREALIMLIQRGTSFVVPRGKTHLKLGDIVTVLVQPAALERVQALLAGEELPVSGVDDHVPTVPHMSSLE